MTPLVLCTIDMVEVLLISFHLQLEDPSEADRLCIRLGTLPVERLSNVTNSLLFSLVILVKLFGKNRTWDEYCSTTETKNCQLTSGYMKKLNRKTEEKPHVSLNKLGNFDGKCNLQGMWFLNTAVCTIKSKLLFFYFDIRKLCNVSN